MRAHVPGSGTTDLDIVRTRAGVLVEEQLGVSAILGVGQSTQHPRHVARLLNAAVQDGREQAGGDVADARG
jgi:hypothetical protein